MLSDLEHSKEKMKILVISQHYWPEPFPLTDVCEALVKRGHSVDVVTDIPNYPMGYIYPEYRKGKNRIEKRNGVNIIRTFTVGRRNNIFFRMLNYFSYSVSSTHYVRGLKEEYDVVFTNQTSPVMMVNAAMVYAKKHKKNSVLYCMDLWPASLAAGGISKSSIIYKVFGWISDKLYNKADKILITSKMFREYFKSEFGIADEIIDYLPQYANNIFDAALPKAEKSGNTFDLVFAGNVGVAQSLTTVLHAAKLLESNKELYWHIVGDGSELENLKSLANDLELKNIIFHGRKPIEDMPKFYAMADAMLVTLIADPLISLTLPAKVQSYMAAGKPIIAAAVGEIANVIAESQCGYCAPAQDSKGLADAVYKFLNCKNKDQLGTNAKNYYDANFTQELFIEKLENELYKQC